MRDIHVVFFEGAFIEKHYEALSSGQLAFRMLGIDALLSAAHPSLRTTDLELFKNGPHQLSCLPLLQSSKQSAPVKTASRLSVLL